MNLRVESIPAQPLRTFATLQVGDFFRWPHSTPTDEVRQKVSSNEALFYRPNRPPFKDVISSTPANNDPVQLLKQTAPAVFAVVS